jgi:hypothetical protein
VVGEEGTPRLRRRTTATAKVLRPGGLRYLDSQLLQLAVDARRAPEWVRFAHLANQDTEVRGQRRPTDASRSRVPPPIESERTSMPRHDGGGASRSAPRRQFGQTLDSQIQSSRSTERRGRFGAVRCRPRVDAGARESPPRARAESGPCPEARPVSR